MRNIKTINEDGSLNKNYSFFKSTGIIAQIFEDHWDYTYTSNKQLIDTYRPNAPIEIQKIIDCYNKNFSCSLYECPSCHDIVFIGLFAFALLAVISTKMIELKISFKSLIIANI